MRKLDYDRIENVFSEALTRERWPVLRAEIKRKALELLGPFPQERCGLDPELLGEERFSGYRRLHVAYRSEPEDRIFAYLLVPDRLKKPAPAVIAIHTSAGSGKDSAVGKTGLKPGDPPDRNMAYALDAVEHGYVVLAPDMDTLGERAPGGRVWDTGPFYRKHPKWSATGKTAWDISRTVDYLRTLDFVDGARIACMGHCFGGYTSVFSAAFDERIRAIMTNSSIWTFRSGRDSWARDPGDPAAIKGARHNGENAGVYTHIPRLADYVGKGIDDVLKPLPVDYYQIACLIPPRGFFISMPSSDLPREGPAAALSSEMLSNTCSALASLYELFGRPDRFEAWTYDSEHDWKPESKTQAFNFLERMLRGKEENET